MLERLFRRIASFSVQHPWRVISLGVAAAVLSVFAAANGLGIKTSNLDLIDHDLPEVKAFLDFAHKFGTPNVLVVVLEGEDEQTLTAAVESIGPALAKATGVRDAIYRLPYEKHVLTSMGIDEYILSHDRKMCFVYVQPADTYSSADQIEPVVRGVRTILDEADLEGMGVSAGMTGIPQYAIDDRDVIQHDISRLSGLSFFLVLVLFVSAFASLRRPALAMISLGFGVVLTLGLITVFPGHLTLLSAFFASILFGLGIDYGIHIINRIEEFAAGGLPEKEAAVEAIAALARELTTGAVTTAAVFYAMNFCGFKGFAELGTVGGTGILVCLLMMISLLPALLMVVPQRKRKDRIPTTRRTVRVLIFLQRPFVAWPLALAVVLSVFVGGPGFDSDYLNLQPEDSESVRLEREMVERSDLSPQFAVFVTDSRERAGELSDRLLDDETVGDVRSIVDLDLLGEGLEVPDSFLRAFESEQGNFAVYAYPRLDVWNPEHQKDFIEHMTAIDPTVTGMPRLGQFMVERTQRALRITAGIGAGLLVVCVFVGLRRPLPTLVAVVPTFLTLACMHAVMRLLGIPFNPINIMALPVIIGIAVDDGVHMVHRYLAERGDLGKTLAGTGRSIVLTSFTTIAAFGSVVFTSHRGLASFAMALCIGVGAALVLTVAVLPVLLNLLKPRLLSSPVQ